MNNSITILLLIFIFGCSTEKDQSYQPIPSIELDLSKTLVPPKTEEYKTIDKAYDVNFQIEQTKDEVQHLVVDMILHNGSHFVSPHSSNRYKGRFDISIEENTHLVLDSIFIETPLSVEEFNLHPFISGLVNLVRVNTSYQHRLEIKSKDDFEVSGMVTFTIEPLCTLEKVRFVISHHAGKLEVKQQLNP